MPFCGRRFSFQLFLRLLPSRFQSLYQPYEFPQLFLRHRPQPDGEDGDGFLSQPVILPGGQVQPEQQVRVAQLLRDNVGEIDQFVQPGAVAGLFLQDGQCFVDPVQQQPGLSQAFHPGFQLPVAHASFRVHPVQQSVQLTKRLLQLLGHRFRKTLQRPGDVPVVGKHHLGVVIKPLQPLLLGLPAFLIRNGVVS